MPFGLKLAYTLLSDIVFVYEASLNKTFKLNTPKVF